MPLTKAGYLKEMKQPNKAVQPTVQFKILHTREILEEGMFTLVYVSYVIFVPKNMQNTQDRYFIPYFSAPLKPPLGLFIIVWVIGCLLFVCFQN